MDRAFGNVFHEVDLDLLYSTSFCFTAATVKFYAKLHYFNKGNISFNVHCTKFTGVTEGAGVTSLV